MNNIPFDINSAKKLLNHSSFYYVICTGIDGNYSYVNESYANKFKFITSDFVGKPYYISMHPDDTSICEEVGEKCYTNPGVLFPAIIRKYDGRGGYIVTQWEFTLIIENNKPAGIFCLGYDITEFVRAKNEVYSVQKDIECKNLMLNAIAFEQSHIVRAPLANVMGLVTILKNLNLGPNASSIITMLEESTNQLDLVIRSIVKKTVD